ncbi:malonate decarboxylase subunit epsilon [Acetobacter conturbans]|uniref:Acyltransferase domain-containing protein n=1 Tax=Acetobacter conturbans TaxID=1737472 RepID=A0ABX0K3M5_9PROT|nr:malonate decarboxylase subunit epsilon [Acetobacter conturbans]NHN90329.1 acyltransferase domain-containing protein [Acetobacter conturbans]
MSGTLAIFCSGQGGQHPRMFSLVEGEKEAEPIFASAEKFLGTDPREYVKTASDEDLYSNRSGQILCCTLSLAIRAVLRDLPDRIVCAGYSVGELPAWGIAGCLTPEQVLALAATRAAIMDQASPQNAGLAGIAGLPDDRLQSILKETGTFIAIVNASDNIVIGGLAAQLDLAISHALQLGASTAKRLHVAVPSHTPLLQSAVDPLLHALHILQPKQPSPEVRLLSGLDGEPILRIDDGCMRLAREVSTTVNWQACLQGCREAGVSRIIETGPGTALTRMARNALSDIPSHATEDFHSVDGLNQWIA